MSIFPTTTTQSALRQFTVALSGFAVALSLWMATLGAPSLRADDAPVPPPTAADVTPPISVEATLADVTAPRLYVASLDGVLDDAMAARIGAAVNTVARDGRYQALILELRTTDGHLTSLETALNHLRSSRVPVYIWVSDKARGPGALLVFAASEVYVSPVATIGPAELQVNDADQVPAALRADWLAKQVDYLATLGATEASRNGRDPNLARAMVDARAGYKVADVELCPPGTALQLDSTAATRVLPGAREPLLARTVVRTFPELLVKIGQVGVKVERQSAGSEGAVASSPTSAKAATGETGPQVEMPADSPYHLKPRLSSSREVPVFGPGDRVVVIPIREEISMKLVPFVARAFREVEADPTCKAVILDMNTPGGLLFAMYQIVEIIRSCKVPVYTYVDTNAISAGAMISLSTRAIYMAPNSLIGDAMPVNMGPLGNIQAMEGEARKKEFSYNIAFLQTLCDENGYHRDLASAFIDPDFEFKLGDEVISPSGRLLTLTANDATRVVPPMRGPLLATAVLPDLEAVCAAIGAPSATMVHIERSRNEILASYLSPLAPLLILGFLLFVYIEFHTPGIGVPGFCALICLVTFIFAQMVGGYAGGVEIFIIFLGVILLAIELFLIPGFGVTGIAGIVLLVIGVIMAMIPDIGPLPVLPNVSAPSVSGEFLLRAVTQLAVAVALAVAAAAVLSRFLPKTRLFSRLVLDHRQSASDGYVGTQVREHKRLIGQVGVAMTDLRPSGTMLLGDRRLDVVSDGGYIEQGAAVTIIEADGPRVVVSLVDPSTPSPDRPAGAPA